MTYYGQPPRPRFRYRDTYIDVPAAEWPGWERITLGEFARRYRVGRRRHGPRCGRAFNKAQPKLRKSQRSQLRRARFQLNRWLGQGGLSMNDVWRKAVPMLVKHLAVQIAYRDAMKRIADQQILLRHDAMALAIMMGSPTLWVEAGAPAFAEELAEGWRLAFRDSQRDLVASVYGQPGGANAGR